MTSALAKKIDALDNGGNGDDLSRFGDSRQCGEGFRLLHWICVPEQVQFKIAVLANTLLHGLGPQYLGPLTGVGDLPGGQCFLSAAGHRH